MSIPKELYEKVNIQSPERIYLHKGFKIVRYPVTGKWYLFIEGERSSRIFGTLTLAKEFLLEKGFLKEGEPLRVKELERDEE